jgi:hypothetical protein
MQTSSGASTKTAPYARQRAPRARQRVEIVQRVLGHRDIWSPLGYAELQEAQVRAALERPPLR